MRIAVAVSPDDQDGPSVDDDVLASVVLPKGFRRGVAKAHWESNFARALAPGSHLQVVPASALTERVSAAERHPTRDVRAP